MRGAARGAVPWGCVLMGMDGGAAGGVGRGGRGGGGGDPCGRQGGVSRPREVLGGGGWGLMWRGREYLRMPGATLTWCDYCEPGGVALMLYPGSDARVVGGELSDGARSEQLSSRCRGEFRYFWLDLGMQSKGRVRFNGELQSFYCLLGVGITRVELLLLDSG
ncbi:hypothetical protein Tco_0083888 [Tanacetum coccineum]